MQASPPKVKNLVLDAGPLLCLTPLRGLAERYLTVPQVLDELKDKRAREHFERLALTLGVQVEVRKPDAVALAKVMVFAKKTGDYAVLSHADLCVLALTHALDEEAKVHRQAENASEAIAESKSRSSQERTPESAFGTPDHPKPTEILADTLKLTHIDSASELLSQSPSVESPSVVPISPTGVDEPTSTPESSSESDSEPTLFEDPSSEDDDGEGEWITPSNVALHKSRALDLLLTDDHPHKTRRGKGKGNVRTPETLSAGCMTADFAMQNVLLQMGLNLVSVEGKRIDRVKTWVLRCHACFKICKDSTKKFCPSCGNPTLLRTSVTASSPTASPDAEPKLQVHLKKNFQWKNRGTIYSIPAPKPGSSKTGAGEGLVLREDQTEWVRAERRAEGRRAREEKKMVNALSAGDGVKLDWMDPDWVPEMLTVGAGGKGRTGKDGMPAIGYGRKNPNERKKRKK